VADAQPTDARARIVLVDDDDLFRESLLANLEDSGFEVTGFPGGAPALAFLNAPAAEADLVILDWKMPDVTGIEVLRRLRGGGGAYPVIFLTTLSDQIYEEAALIGGAVDFVEKSRSFAILLRRIENALNAGGAADGAAEDGDERDEIAVGPLSLRIANARAQWKGEAVPLTLGEFNIVAYMARRAGDDVRYREIYDAVRGSGFAAGAGPEGYRVNVRTAIKRIRKKFRDIDDDFDWIENYPGFGYRWRDS
jgi:two-component system response regulator ChvI